MSSGSYVKSLFCGEVVSEWVFPFPLMPEAERAQVLALTDLVGRFLKEEVDPAAIDATNAVPPNVMNGLAELGLFGLRIPSEFGGLGLSMRGYARVIQEVATASPALAHILIAHESKGAMPLHEFGSAQLKRLCLGKLASGGALAAFALAEPRSGTDASAMLTRLTPDAKDGGHRLSGTKAFVTNGTLADAFVVFARTTPPDQGEKPHITAVWVERGPGVSTGPAHDSLGLRGAGVCDVTFDNVHVQEDCVLGTPTRGYSVAVQTMSAARVPLAAAYMGQCRTLIRHAVDHVGRRRSFGRPIQDFPVIKDKIARMIADAYSLESTVYLTAGMMDHGAPDTSLESALGRILSSEALWRIAQAGLQISGAAGFASDSPASRHLRDARAAHIFDGTNETVRCFVALQGMREAGGKIAGTAGAAESARALDQLRDFAARKVKSLGKKDVESRAHELLAAQDAVFSKGAEAFAKAVEDKLLEHGTEISEMQIVQHRISDIAMDLFALTACIARASAAIERNGEDGARREIDVTAMIATSTHDRLGRTLKRLYENDDSLRKRIASRTCTDGGYPVDVI